MTSGPAIATATRELWHDRPALRTNVSATAREVVDLLGWPATRLRSVRRAVAKLAMLATSGEPRMKEEVEGMPKGTPNGKLNADDLGVLVGREVEARCTGGGCYRGTLQAVGADFLRIERSTTARAIYIRRAGVLALVDETPPGLQAAGRRQAEEL